MFKSKSGAQKRQENKEEVKCKFPKLDSFFLVPSPTELEPSNDTNDHALPCCSTSVVISSSSTQIEEVAEMRTTTEVAEILHIHNTIQGNDFPTGRGNFPQNIADANVKRYILQTGPCKLRVPFHLQAIIDFQPIILRPSIKLVLNCHTAGSSIPLNLMCAYCEPCLLFAVVKAPCTTMPG